MSDAKPAEQKWYVAVRVGQTSVIVPRDAHPGVVETWRSDDGVVRVSVDGGEPQIVPVEAQSERDELLDALEAFHEHCPHVEWGETEAECPRCSVSGPLLRKHGRMP